MSQTNIREVDVKRKPVKFSNAENARVLRQNDHSVRRRITRFDVINERRGLSNSTLLNVNVPVAPIGKPKTELELKSKLKVYKEQKRIIEAQRKAVKKPVFVVPTHSLAPASTTTSANAKTPVSQTNRAKEAAEKLHKKPETSGIVTRSTAAVSALQNQRITRSQAQKLKPSVLQLTVPQESAPSKKSYIPKKTTLKASPKVPEPAKTETVRRSFVPTADFQFKAPSALSNFSHLFNQGQEEKLTMAISGLSFMSPVKKIQQGTQENSFDISPVVFNNPNITMTRGSSSRRKQAKYAEERLAEAEKAALSSPAIKTMENPIPTLREEAQACPVPKLEMESVVEDQEIPQEGSASSQNKDTDVEVEPKSEKPVEMEPKASDASEKSVEYFRNLVKHHAERLRVCWEEWESLLDGSDASVPENVCGDIRCAVYKAQLLVKDRFEQFLGLIDNCEFQTGEKPVHCSDLAGFWDLISLPVADVDSMFEDLHKVRANNWQKEEETVTKPTVVKKKVAKKPVKKVTGQATRAKSSLQEMINAKRRQLSAAKSPRASPRNRLSTPGSSVARSAASTSTKKATEVSGTPRRSGRRSSTQKLTFTPGSKPESREQPEVDDEVDSLEAQTQPMPTIHIDSPGAVRMKEIPMPEIHHTYSRKQPVVDTFSPEKERNAVFDSLLENPLPVPEILAAKYLEPYNDSSPSPTGSFDIAEEPEDLLVNFGDLDASTRSNINMRRRSKLVSAAFRRSSTLPAIPEAATGNGGSISTPTQVFLDTLPGSARTCKRQSRGRLSLLLGAEDISRVDVAPGDDLMQF